MKRLLRPGLALALALAVTTVFAAAATSPDDPSQPFPDRASTVLAHLASKRPLRASFVEHRQIQGRKAPLSIRGELRLDPARGLSLAYERGREPFVVVVDDRGIAVKQGGRPFRSQPAARAGMPLDMLRGLLAGSPEAIAHDWSEDPTTGAWRLETRAADGESGWTSLVMSGSPEAVDRLVITLARGGIITLELAAPQPVAAWSPEDLACFRPEDAR